MSVASAPPLPAPRRRGPEPGVLALYVAFTFLALIFVLPLLLMLSDAFKSQDEIMRIPPTLLPAHPSLQSFRTVLSDSPYLTWYRNSLVVSTTVTALTLFTSSLAGYIFAKFEFPLKNVIFVALLASLMVPFPVTFIPSYLVVNYLHLLNTLYALIVPSIVSAFGVFLMRQFISAIPNELIESARIDGAGEFTIYRRLIVPLTGSAMAALGIFTFLESWNDYLWPLVVINDTDKSTLPLALSYFNSVHAQRFDLVMAATTMAIVPVVILFIIFQRQIVEAMVLSGLKG